MSKLKLPTVKKYNSQIKGKWQGNPHTFLIFTKLYIQEKYKNILHVLPFIHLYIDEYEYFNKKSKFSFGIKDWNKLEAYEVNGRNK